MGYCGVFRRLTLRRKFFLLSLKKQKRNPSDVKMDGRNATGVGGMKFLENV